MPSMAILKSVNKDQSETGFLLNEKDARQA
jgi:hypothetical protein